MRGRAWAVILSWVVAANGRADEPKKAVTISAADMKWSEIPNTKIQLSTLWGDFNKSAHGAIAKFPAGDEHPMHSHSANLKLIILQGNYLFNGVGEKAKVYPPGSYLMIPGGYKHFSGCDKSGPCVVFQEGDAAFDMTPAEPKKAPPAKK